MHSVFVATRLALCLCSVIRILFGQPNVDARSEQDMRDMERQWRQAWLTADAAALDRIQAEDYTAIFNIGTVSTKPEVMADAEVRSDTRAWNTPSSRCASTVELAWL